MVAASRISAVRKTVDTTVDRTLDRMVEAVVHQHRIRGVYQNGPGRPCDAYRDSRRVSDDLDTERQRGRSHGVYCGVGIGKNASAVPRLHCQQREAKNYRASQAGLAKLIHMRPTQLVWILSAKPTQLVWIGDRGHTPSSTYPPLRNGEGWSWYRWPMSRDSVVSFQPHGVHSGRAGGPLAPRV